MLAGIFGTLVGLVAGYAGGVADESLMRLTDVFLAFPSLILAMAIAGALGPTLTNAILAIAVVTWPVYARLIRGQLLSLRRREYVEAARAIGASGGRILVRHLLPNAAGPVLVQASFDMGAAIIAVAGLSFIGFGVKQPDVSLGSLLGDGANTITSAPWLFYFPALMLSLLTVSMALIGDGLRDALDPMSYSAGTVRRAGRA